MRILYIGSACNEDRYELMLEKCKVRPTVAPLIFETLLLSGIRKSSNANITVLSRPILPSFPKGRPIAWGARKEKLRCGIECKWIPTINFYGIKELFQEINGYFYIRSWLKQAKDNQTVILTYSVDSLAKPIQCLCKKYGAKSVCIIADLPVHGYFAGRKLKIVKRKMAELYTKNLVRMQSGFDGYIFLTESMRHIIGDRKPYSIVEGIADIQCFEKIESVENRPDAPPAILYAGTLAQRYGIKLLMDAFELCSGNYELWICGSGDYEKQIIERAGINTKIKFLGRMTHKETLVLEKQACLLVNVRNKEDEYTKYSFPSKMMEYMLSGTPVATTKLSGIPEEYFKYVYTISGKSYGEIAIELDQIMNDTNKKEVGRNARNFIIENKSDISQGRKVNYFLQSM